MKKSYDLVEDVSVHWSWSDRNCPFGRVSNFSVQRDADTHEVRIVIDTNPMRGQLSCEVFKAILKYYCLGAGNPNKHRVEAVMKKDENEEITAEILKEIGFTVLDESKEVIAFEWVEKQ